MALLPKHKGALTNNIFWAFLILALAYLTKDHELGPALLVLMVGIWAGQRSLKPNQSSENCSKL